MAVSNLVSFKVYLVNENSGEDVNEVRRFGIESEVATSYSYLTEKLKTVFPYLKNFNNFQIYWKDNENDSIRICSDHELIIALTEMQEPLKKLFIRVNQYGNNDIPEKIVPGYSAGDGNDSANKHPGVICDGCEGSVVGFRYKCLQCRNYDLCSNCEIKGCHSEHFMLRMPTPANVDAWIHDGRRDKGSHHSKWHRVALAASKTLPTLSGYHHSKKHSKKHHHKQENPENLSALICECVGDVMRQVGNVISQPPVVNPTEESCKSSNTNNVKETPAAMHATGTSSGIDQSSSSNPQPNIGNLLANINLNDALESVMHNLQSMNLGGVISSATENNNANTSQHTKNDETNANSNDIVNGNNTNKYTGEIPNLNSVIQNFLSGAISELSKAQKLCEGVKNEVGASKVSENMPTVIPTAPQDEHILTPEQLNKLILGDDDGIRVKAVTNNVVPSSEVSNSVSQNAEKTSASNSVSDNEDPSGFVLLDGISLKHIPNKGAIPKTFTSPTTNLEDDANNSQKVNETKKENSPIEIKIQQSLNRMRAMGFSNENDWLLKRLTEHDGSIEAVLEELLPKRRYNAD